ncbi:hypothetical protein [Myroides pelagicus]|uniref:Helix-turn-helix domain-containing protein n=1 Tax=Myroides pelagicus TaxID=270914 RepID=A0A7K1GPM0_9FLAO|nr:hypothetical protein [Myroides pelagicus]MEC4113193.1 hypothetical protein [Myroides pelagicus]MTH30154.1 hypothetical protein [Myroides pelagicus]
MLSERIKKYLAVKGLTSIDLALMLKVDESLLNTWLDTDKINDALLYKLIEAFPDIDLNFLIKGDDCTCTDSKQETSQEEEAKLATTSEIKYHLNQIELSTQAIKRLLK